MPDYYKILGVSPDSTSRQIKSAYRRLARTKHPDLNEGDEKYAREFAKAAEAYRILSNPRQRARYDRARISNREGYGSFVAASDNPHARKLRQMALQRQYDAIIDRMIADERAESLALRNTIFPIVALFTSIVFIATFKPLIWTNSGVLVKGILFSLFVAGTVQMVRRFIEGFERYTYSPLEIHDSIFDDGEIAVETRIPRITAASFLVIGAIVSLIIGLLIGNFLGLMNEAMMGKLFSSSLRLEFILYPPIVVLLVDGMQSLLNRLEH